VSKVTRILLAIGLILAVATPALAEFKFNGVYNLKSYVEEKKSTSKEEGDSQQFIDQRFRAKLTYSLNDNVAVVYFAEVDTVWGEESKGSIGDGGQVTYRTGGADGVNIETKNVYLDLKFGDTAATLGITTLADAFGGVVFLEDMAGLNVTHKIGNTSLRVLYSKWDEDFDKDTKKDAAGGVRSHWDDFDFYAAEVKQKINDNFTVGAGVYFMDDNSYGGLEKVTPKNQLGDREVWFYGVNADVRFGNFGIDGFAIMQDGEYTASEETLTNYNYDVEGLAASARAAMKLDNGDVGLRVMYFSDDDDDKDEGRWQGFQGEYFFVNDNQMQFLVDKYVANDGKEMYAIKDAVDKGFGLLGFVLSGNHKLPQSMYLNWGAGYYLALEEETDGYKGAKKAKGEQILAADKYRRGDTLGYEIAARIGKKFFEKVDVSLNASYAGYGDFYDDTVKEGTKVGDPDDTYKAYLMVNVPF
jgi:hypothetical protein